MAIITLTTDFGTQDEYVGVVKGVIYGIHAQAVIVDLTHAVPAQDVRAAAHLVSAAFHYFPLGTVHVAVVDPGVGSDRAIVGASVHGHYFLAPDNGLLVPLIRQYGADHLIALRENRFFRHPVSKTFHGRDIFAPVAAHLALGEALSRFGPELPLAALTNPPWSAPMIDETGQVSGHVVWVDRFGNLISDIHVDRLTELRADKPDSALRITVGPHTITGMVENYSHGSDGGAIAVIGSRNCLEIAINQGSAATALGLGMGAGIHVSRVSAPQTAPRTR